MITPENVASLPLDRLRHAYRTAQWAREMVREAKCVSLEEVRATNDFADMLKREMERREADLV